MAQVRLFTGPVCSGREAHIDGILQSRWGHAILITPTRYRAARRIERLIEEHQLPGVYGSPILSFEDFSTAVLRSEGHAVFPVEEFERRLLVEGVVRRLASAGRLSALGDAAATNGFISHALRTITQLKQAAAEPEQFREAIAQRQRPSWLDTIVADVYEGYQQALIEAGSYDRVGIYWMADLAVRKARPRILADIDTLIFDGWEDFTPSEFRHVESLAEHVESLVFGIDCSADQADQADLYAIPLVTVDRIARTFRIVERREFDAPQPLSHAEFLARNIFWRSRPPAVLDLKANVAIRTAPDLRQEIEYVGRYIKTLAAEQEVACDRIAVVARNLSDVAPVIRSVFGEFGIPFHLCTSLNLAQTSLGVFVLTLFEALDGWPRDAVMDLLTAPWFDAAQSPSRHLDLAPQLVRRAGIIEGQKEWENRIARLLGRLEEGTDEEVADLLARFPDITAATQCLSHRLGLLAETDRKLPRSATPSAYVEALEGLLTDFGAAAAFESFPEPAVRASEESAWTALLAVLGRIDAWYCREKEAPQLDRTEFVALLRNAFEEAQLPLPASNRGVWCLEAQDMRDRSFDYVFLCAMNEGEFPRPPAANAIYTDQDLRDFADQGVRLDDKGRHANREMLTFHHVVRAARVELCLTWHVLSRDGRAGSPSPFFIDAEDLLKPFDVRKTALDQPVFAPNPRDAASRRDLRNTAFNRSPALQRQLLGEFTHVRRAITVEKVRQDSTPFGIYDGILEAPALLEQLAAVFGPDHSYSVNQLESYATCPFRFFMGRVLDVESDEEPGVEFDPRVRGTILHDVLQAFHTEFRGKPLADIPEEVAGEAMTRHLDRVFAERARRSINTPEGMMTVERARMAVVLRRYLLLSRKHDPEPWAPTHFEVSFGNAHGTTEDSLSQTDPFVLETPQGAARFSGRINRIDLKDGRARIIDYKTSVYVKPADIEAGVSLQLSLYALALEQMLMPGTACADAAMVQVGGKERLSGLTTKNFTWDDMRKHTPEIVAKHVAGIQSGHFPPTPYKQQCITCSAHRACRYESARIERKLEAAR